MELIGYLMSFTQNLNIDKNSVLMSKHLENDCKFSCSDGTEIEMRTNDLSFIDSKNWNTKYKITIEKIKE